MQAPQKTALNAEWDVIHLPCDPRNETGIYLKGKLAKMLDYIEFSQRQNRIFSILLSRTHIICAENVL